MPDKMRYDRTFRCSKRALEYFGPSLRLEFYEAMEPEYTIDPSVVGKLIAKLANRKECMIFLAFKPFHGKKAPLGNALIIDCVPVLETLGPDFQQSDIEFGSSREMFAMLDLKEMFDEPQQTQREKAWSELQESFYFKLLKTFQELPQRGSYSV